VSDELGRFDKIGLARTLLAIQDLDWLGTCLKEVLKNSLAVGGKDGFRMKLDAPHWVVLVAQAHDDAVIGFRCNLQAVWQAASFHDEGMVSCCGKWIWQSSEQLIAGVLNFTRLAVHDFGRADDVSALGLADALMTQAHAQDGNCFAKKLDDVEGNTCFIGRTGPG
jgi:hypothetical protein